MIGSTLLADRNHRWVAARLIVGSLLAVSAGVLLLLIISPWSESKAVETESHAAVVEPIEGSELSNVILSEEAAERLGIETATVGDANVESAAGETAMRKVIPYSAVLYDVNGGTYVYISPEPLTFVRAPITVDNIDGETAVLLDGPSTGTAVVTVGAAELFGAEFEFEED